MRRPPRLPFVLLLTLATLTACGRSGPAEPAVSEQAAPAYGMAPPAAAAPVQAAEGGAGSAPADNASPQRRYLALRHDLTVFTDAGGVEAAWKAAGQACAAAGCEVLASSLVNNADQHPTGASLEARVPPQQLDAFLAKVTALGSVGQHTTQAEDKTDEVIDTEARLKNMSEFRDNLRRLMATPKAKLGELIEVERELTRVQSEIDSLASRRKALAGLTDKVHVVLSFQARPSVIETGMWSPVRGAVLNTGHLLAASLATLIELTAALLPWALALLALGSVVRAIWRRRSKRRATTT